MMGRGYSSGGFGLMGGGSLLIILILVVIGLVIYFAMKKNTNGNKKDASFISSQKTESTALDIAKSRLAKGEISLEEFEQIKKNL